jgi:hypothetical protein
MSSLDLRDALPDAFAPRLPRTRASLLGRWRALSAARLAVALFLGTGAQPIAAEPRCSPFRARSPIASEGVVA